ncbi:MAG: hypothetical protein GX418_12950 [Clostridiales bacterium]|nr:hypothetical protein [Clostridiales bacterium]
MEIVILSLKQAYAKYRDPGSGVGVALIACSSYPIRENALPEVPDKLFLDFDDVPDERRPHAFTPAMADAARVFLMSLRPDLRTLAVCCDGGQSRSAALAAAILRAQGGQDQCIWRDARYSPNPLVFRLQCDALGVPVSAAGLRYRVWRNRRAFSRAGRR